MRPRNKRTAAGNNVAPDNADGNANVVIDGGDAGNGAGGIPGVADSIVIEPDAVTVEPIAGPGSDGAEPRRPRGRPPGSGKSGSGKSQKSLPLNVNGLEKLLVGIHAGVATLAANPLWALDTESKLYDGKSEAAFLSGAIKDVSQHYTTGVFDQKTLDWANLIQCLALVYGGRFMMARSMRKTTVAAPRPQAVRTAPPPQFHQATPVPPAPEFAGQHAGPSFKNEPPPKVESPPQQVEIPGVGTIDVSKMN